jgi:hypothetical protein
MLIREFDIFLIGRMKLFIFVRMRL